MTPQNLASQSPATQDAVGQSMARVEDPALLRGRGQYMDDLGVPPGTVYAAFVRSPHAHANILSIDCAAALAIDGVVGCLTGPEVTSLAAPFVVGVKQPMAHWCLAIDRVRYVGEPVAIVCATDRYIAEDAAAQVMVRYEPLQAFVNSDQAMEARSGWLHEDVGSNVVSDRHFRYGDPEAAFKNSDHVIEIDIEYPRNSVTPIECNGAVATFIPGDESYDIISNFQGPFAIHPVMALALKVPGNRLRMRTPPDSGGSFGTKHSVFPYLVALALASRVCGRPVKWIEDRLEHLTAATAATSRKTRLRAAVGKDGKIEALDYDQIEDCGAYLRAPEPATIYRMHGNMTGAYAIDHLRIRNQIVLTNKTPSGLVRGFGGPQVYFALERLTQRIAKRLGLNHLDVIKRNLIPATAFPYRTTSGGLLDSGDYASVIARLENKDYLADLYQRKDKAIANGRLYGIGYAAIVEPSISNMGYITTVLTHEQREKAGPKGGALATASVSVDPLGAVTVHVASVPQGQGHRTVLAQVVSAAFGIRPDDVRVAIELDTRRDPWSVASGNYSSRFAGAVAGTAHLAATRLRDRLAVVASEQLGCESSDVRFENGRVFDKDNEPAGLPFRRVAATSHWAEGTRPQGGEPVVRETAFWSPDTLRAPNALDEINSSAAHGFVFDICGVDIDPGTGQVRVDRYVTAHDAGVVLHPAMADGQVRGGFANALGAALFEHFSYGQDGSFLSGTFADYTVPTAAETPDIAIVHHETPSPITPLGAKGLGEGNCMSTPVAIANAVADALDLDDVTLPLTPPHVLAMILPEEPPPPEAPAEPVVGLTLPSRDYALEDQGDTLVNVDPATLWPLLLDPELLATIIPGCEQLEKITDTEYRGLLRLGVGMVSGRFAVTITISALRQPNSLQFGGTATGPLGSGNGDGVLELIPEGSGKTRLAYRYGVNMSGRIASVGARMLGRTARGLIKRFFDGLGRALLTTDDTASNTDQSVGLWRRMRRSLGMGNKP